MLRYRLSPTGHRYGFLGQQAQTGIVGYGRTLEEAFEGVAAAMFALIADLARVHPLRTIPVSFVERDPEAALVTWLDLLLRSARDEKLVFAEFSLVREGMLWRGCAAGQSWPNIEESVADRMSFAKVGSVRQIATVWEARCLMKRRTFSRDWRPTSLSAA